MGDILFIGILAFIFATHAYIAFLIMALGFSLVAHFIIKRLLSHKEHTVALAGWMALFLAVYWIGQMVGISIFNDFGAY